MASIEVTHSFRTDLNFPNNKTIDPEASINQIPHELLVMIFSYLSPKELGNIASVSRQWNKISSSDILWNPFCKDQFPQNFDYPPQVLLKNQLKDNSVQWKYLPISRDRVTIKSRNLRTTGTSVKIQPEQYKYRCSALFAQNTTSNIDDYDENRLYPALAKEIFGNVPEKELGNYIKILKCAAADYILDHPMEFLTAIANNNLEEKNDAALRQQLEEHCAQMKRLEREDKRWLDVEIAAISALFRIPIHIFNSETSCKIGNEGIEDGVIQPHFVFGESFVGAPIRMLYTPMSSEYYSIQLKTVQA